MMFKPLMVPVVLAVIVEARVRAPAEVILLEVEKKLISPVTVPDCKVKLPVPLAVIVKASLACPERVDRASPPPLAADLMFKPVVLVAVEVSTLKAGLVVPPCPTARALAEVAVMVWAPEVIVPVEVKLLAPIARVPPMVSPVRVPTEVMLVWAAVVTVPAVVALPAVVAEPAVVADVAEVALPLKAPAKVVAVIVPVEGL